MAEEPVNNKTVQVAKTATPVHAVPKNVEKVVKPVEELSGVPKNQPAVETKVTQPQTNLPTEMIKYTSNVFHHSKSFGDPLMLETIRLMPMTEYFIMALHLGLVNGKNYSINGIASFLEMGNESVRKIIMGGLENYKNAISNTIENEIEQIYKIKMS